jgi:amino acid adenylation domain
MQDTKKVAGELLVELEKKGVTFETVDGKLKYKDSKGNFTENSKEKVKKYKEEIIEILKKKQTIDEFITDNDYETNVYPLTDVQAAYLVGKTEAVKWGGIGCKGYIEVDFGSYSAEELSRAWKVLVNRHEMLRAKVTEVGFEILERDEIDYEIKIVNLQKMAEREKVDTLSKIREDFSEYVFHTEEPPLFKVLITKRIEGNFFHLLVDLIVSDFASVQLLISEMGELLKGASLEKIRYKFSDYAMFNQQRKGSLKWHQDRMYWLERLKKLPEAPILPQDGRAADKCENTYEFYRFQKHINQSDWKRIKEIAGEYGVTVSSVLIGIYAEVISRWSSNKHFTLNLPIQNRPKHNAKATLISQKKEYVELAKSIKKIVCSISGNDYIDYEDNLLENGLDSLLLSQISGRIVSDIQEAQGMRFDEILRASLTMPTIMGIAQYISDCKNPSKNQMHSNAGNQTRNSYTVVYIFGDNENEIRDVLIEKLSASNISCKRVGGQEIIERCHEDISVKKKYIIAFSEMASLCITKASELLGENIIINRIFLINPSKAKESDLYLGDISIIDGNSVAIKSWEKAVLGNVREFESNSNDIFDIIMRELENDK